MELNNARLVFLYMTIAYTIQWNADFNNNNDDEPRYKMNYWNQNYLITVDTGKSKVIKQLAGDVEKEEQDPSDSIKQKEKQQQKAIIMTESEQLREKYGEKEQTETMPALEKEKASIASTIIKAEEATLRIKDDQQRNPTIMTESLKDKESLQKKIKSGDGSHIEAEDR